MSDKDPRSILEKFYEQQTTDEMMEKIQDADYCYLKFIPMSHLVMIVAPGNTGKTAFAIHASAEMARSGFEVIYINADASAPDLKFYHNHARTNGYALISPDLSNKSTDDIVKLLQEMARSADDLTNLVIVLDTIKKFVDVIQKSQAKAFFKLLRSLTAKGVTVIGLGHTNKNQDSSGKLIYEGTGDIRNDTDELYIMESDKQSDGTLKVSAYMDKCRADVEEITFVIRKDRTVTIEEEFYDGRSIKTHEEQLKKDQLTIDFIRRNLTKKDSSPTELEALSKAMGNGFSRRNIDKVLRAYSNGDSPLWIATKAPKNGLIYSLVNAEASAPLQSCKVC